MEDEAYKAMARLLITQIKVQLLVFLHCPIRFSRDAQKNNFFKGRSFTGTSLPLQIALPDLSFQTNCRAGQKFAIHKKPRPRRHADANPYFTFGCEMEGGGAGVGGEKEDR